MVENTSIVVFEGGVLSAPSESAKNREAVLALPLNRLLMRLVRVPAEYRDEPFVFATDFLRAFSPYPDEPLTVSCETVRETADSLVVLAAALPEGATDDLAAALDEAKLNITRVDALALGHLRLLWSAIHDGRTNMRRLLLMQSVDCISLFVLDDDLPSAVRALSAESDIRREIMLSLLEAEEFGGAKELSEVIAVGEFSPDAREIFATFAPVRTLETSSADALIGLADRANDPSTLNALPEAWADVLEETRFKSKLKHFLVISGAIWALIMATLFGVPFVYGFMTTHQKNLSKEHARRYQEVKEMREKVRLVQKYSDHTRGSLEILKAISDRLPAGVELNSWNFRRESGVRFSGEAADASSVYLLKDSLVDTMLKDENDDETKLFAEVILTGPSAGRGGKQRFEIECKFETEEE